MSQRHARSRSWSLARASTSMAFDTDLLRPRLTRRNASLTVSLIVSVPNCAWAAPRASSSMSTRCLAISRSIYERAYVYTPPTALAWQQKTVKAAFRQRVRPAPSPNLWAVPSLGGSEDESSTENSKNKLHDDRATFAASGNDFDPIYEAGAQSNADNACHCPTPTHDASNAWERRLAAPALDAPWTYYAADLANEWGAATRIPHGARWTYPYSLTA